MEQLAVIQLHISCLLLATLRYSCAGLRLQAEEFHLRVAHPLFGLIVDRLASQSEPLTDLPQTLGHHFRIVPIEEWASAVALAVPADETGKAFFEKWEESFLGAWLQEEDTAHHVYRSRIGGGLGHCVETCARVVNKRHEWTAQHANSNARA